MGFDALRLDKCLKFLQLSAIFPDLTGKHLVFQRLSYQQTDGFANAPFDGMPAKTPIGDVRGADIFVGGQQIFHALRNQRPQGNLERQRTKIHVIVARRTGVQVDVVVAHANTIQGSEN